MRFIPSTEGPQVADRVPTTLAAFDAREAAQERAQAEKLDQAHHDAIVFSAIAREPQELHHEQGSLTARPYDSISQGRYLVAVHCRGTQPDGTPSAFVLWFEPDEARTFARGLNVVITHTENLEAERG